MQAPKKLNSLYISSHAPTIVAIANGIRAVDPKEVEWATYKLKYASCKHRPIMMFLKL
jgi:hypothetical protein